MLLLDSQNTIYGIPAATSYWLSVTITGTSGTNKHFEQINKMSDLLKSLPLGLIPYSFLNNENMEERKPQAPQPNLTTKRRTSTATLLH